LPRRISSALAMSPSASVTAFLHSIMGASVLARSSATMLAVIAIVCSPWAALPASGRTAVGDWKWAGEKGAARAPPLCDPERKSGGGSVVDFDEFVTAFGGSGLGHLGHGIGAAFEHGVGDATGVQRHGAGRVIVAGDHVVDADRRVVGIHHTH